MSLRTIPVNALGHGADCRICATVDRWAANRKPLRRLAERRSPDLAGGRFGASPASRDETAAFRSGPESKPTGAELAVMSDADFASFIEDSGIATLSKSALNEYVSLRARAGRSPASSFPPVGTGLGVERPAGSRERITGPPPGE